MPAQGSKYLLLIFTSAETLALLFQIFNYLSRKQDLSRLRFMLLIFGFVIFNLINLYIPNLFGLGDLYSKVIAYSSGVLLAAGYLIYIFKEFDIIDKKIDVKGLVWLLVITLSIGYVTTNIVLGTSDVARNVLVFLPIAISTTFCTYMQFQFRKKIELYKIGLYYKIMLYSSYLGLILMSSIPMFIYIGKYDLNLSLINILFICTIAIYIHRLLTENKREFQVLNQIGYFSTQIGYSSAEESILNYNLSKRELEIANFILNDLSYSEIANLVFLAEGTVTKHASNIFKKTGCINREKFREKFLNGTESKS